MTDLYRHFDADGTLLQGRKWCINMAMADGYEADGEKMAGLFNPAHWMVKITPIHVNTATTENNIKSTDGYDLYDFYAPHEESFKKAGFDTLVFVPSYDEDFGMITCGNAVLSGRRPTIPFTETQFGVHEQEAPMVGGKIIEIKNEGMVSRLWCMDGNDECAVMVQNAQVMPVVGDAVWWQSGKVYWNNDRSILEKVGYSFDPRRETRHRLNQEPTMADKTKVIQPVDIDEFEKVKETLGTLISWMASSSNSPISRAEAEMLLSKLNKQE